jgi:hypothetical protein
MHPRCTQECACKIFSNNTIICLIPFAQKCGHVLHISEPIGSHLNRIVLVIKACIWGALNLFIYFREGPIKVAHYKKTLNFGCIHN